MLKSDSDKIVKGIHQKVRSLISLHATLKHQHGDLLEDHENLKQKIKDQKELIEQLKDKNRNLKIARSVKQLEGNDDVKKRIDDLVREIDKCIGLLNI